MGKYEQGRKDAQHALREGAAVTAAEARAWSQPISALTTGGGRVEMDYWRGYADEIEASGAAGEPRTYMVLGGETGKAVGRGFWGDDPDRFWVHPGSDDARLFSREEAERFVRTTGDKSWNWRIVEVHDS